MIYLPQQFAAIVSNENRCLNSCPGSGKTRTVVGKLLNCIEEVRGTTRKVGCITYTNAAVNEIEARVAGLQGPSDDLYFEIGTIHAFCLNNVVAPFRRHVSALAPGFQIVSPESEWYRKVVTALIKEFNLKIWAYDGFGSIQRQLNGSLFYPDGVSKAAAEKFMELTAKASLITLTDIVYYAWKLLLENKYISRGLAARFAWLLVDEFQDTSALQVEILRAICGHGKTKLFLVGDPNQSIMGFAGARPELMGELSSLIGAKTDISLLGNHRCSKLIVNAAERLCPSKPPMSAIGPNRDFPDAPVYRHVVSPKEGILGVFLPEVAKRGIQFGEVAVLAPQWPTLFELGRTLRSKGVPVVGPGARPYRRSLEFAQFAEHACAFLESGESSEALALERALFLMLLNLSGQPDLRVYSYSGKKTLFRILQSLLKLRQEKKSAIQWIQDAAAATADVLVANDYLTADQAKRLVESANAIVRGIVQSLGRKGRDPHSLTVDDLGMFARPKNCVHLITLHGSKGREFDAVAIVNLNEDKIPHWANKGDEAAIRESQRLLYVGVTRARKVLMLFSDQADGKPPTRFLGKQWLALH